MEQYTQSPLLLSNLFCILVGVAVKNPIIYADGNRNQFYALMSEMTQELYT